MLTPMEQAETLYDTLFDWQPPLSLWERSESLKILLGDDILASRNAGRMEIKKILEGWVAGKSLTMAYHGESCLVRVALHPAVDAQIYQDRHLKSVEVTQALYPGRKRNVFGGAGGSLASFDPIAAHERVAYEQYRDAFARQAFLQVEARIEHKFQLYARVDYLLVHVDLFDASQPRFNHFARAEFARSDEDDLHARLALRYRNRWSARIGELFLLDDKPAGFVTRFGAAAMPAPVFTSAPALHAQLSLA